MDNLSDKKVKKVLWTLRVIKDLHPVPSQYLKKLRSVDDIWEVRVVLGNNAFRLLGFIHDGDILVLTNGFAKKSDKVSTQEIEKAEQRKKQYLWERGYE